jgi:hypothetical protein
MISETMIQEIPIKLEDEVVRPNLKVVARERFELSSAAPEAAMFDHCTTGLRSDG